MGGVTRQGEPIATLEPGRGGRTIAETFREGPVAPADMRAGERPAPPPASPAARRLARELGLDLASVTGSGPGGRIVEADVVACGGSRAANREAAVADATDDRGAAARWRPFDCPGDALGRGGLDSPRRRARESRVWIGPASLLHRSGRSGLGAGVALSSPACGSAGRGWDRRGRAPPHRRRGCRRGRPRRSCRPRRRRQRPAAARRRDRRARRKGKSWNARARRPRRRRVHGHKPR